MSQSKAFLTEVMCQEVVHSDNETNTGRLYRRSVIVAMDNYDNLVLKPLQGIRGRDFGNVWRGGMEELCG